MVKRRRLAAAVVAGMLGMQLLGAGTAIAADVPAECDFGGGALVVTLGRGERRNANIWIDGDSVLRCNRNGPTEWSAPAASIDSITVRMADGQSDGALTIVLDSLAEWPRFETFDIDVTTRVFLDGSMADFDLKVFYGGGKLVFNRTRATFDAPGFVVSGGSGDDLIAGGRGDDQIFGNGGRDRLYGNGGSDLVDCNGLPPEVPIVADDLEIGFGGRGDDRIVNCGFVAPGQGDDVVRGLGGQVFVSYADVADGVTWTHDGTRISTGGAAGDDRFRDVQVVRLYGSRGADTIVDYGTPLIFAWGGADLVRTGYLEMSGRGATVYGGDGDDVVVAIELPGDPAAGDAVISSNQVFYGGAGSDELRGAVGDDVLRGGPGEDEAWGGSGDDVCDAEVIHACESTG